MGKKMAINISTAMRLAQNTAILLVKYWARIIIVRLCIRPDVFFPMSFSLLSVSGSS